MNRFKDLGLVVLWTLITVLSVNAQKIGAVHSAKDRTTIPPACESIASAAIEPTIDIKALLKESNCKGSGDMMSDYAYILKSVKREPGNKGQIKEESIVYEVFMPARPNGVRGRGVLLVISRNDVPVPPQELEKERTRAGERLEKEEKKAASNGESQTQTAASRNGILPLGSYGRFALSGEKAVVDVHTFLANCDLTLRRREQVEGREMLVFTFTALPNAQFRDNEKYIAQLKGETWIDVKDRIVTRLIGWPQTVIQSNEKSPAVYYQMVRLPTGVWLPHLASVNGVDYPGLFGRILFSSSLTFSEYKRFSTEVKEQKLETPVVLAPDVAEIFKSSEVVNALLRSSQRFLHNLCGPSESLCAH